MFFIDFRSRCPVTSGDVIPHSSNARDLGIILGGICICSRFYSTPCFFGYIATHAQGLGRSLRFTHAQTNSVNSTAQGLLSKQANPLLLSDGRNESREQIDDVSHANEARNPKNNSPLSFWPSDWLVPTVAMYTTLANYQLTTIFLAKYRLTVNPIRTLTQGKV